MIIHHDGIVLVADGQRFLLLRNAGDADRMELTCEESGGQDNPATAEQGTDAPGRAFSSTGSMRSAMGQTDFHRLGKERFAEEVAAIAARFMAGREGQLVVVAPPATLAQLRENFPPQLAGRIAAEIDKDLIGHPLPEIARLLGKYGH